MLVGFGISTAFSSEPVNNRAWAQLSHVYMYITDQDSIENVPLEWSISWMMTIVNLEDFTHEPMINPRITVKSSLNFVEFNPDDPAIFVAQPDLDLYTWDFSGHNLPEFKYLHAAAWEAENVIVERPRFTLSRTVTPEVLTGKATLQTVTITFKLEEPLPDEIQFIYISIGDTPDILHDPPLVEVEYVDQNEIDGWDSRPDKFGPYWMANFPFLPEVGRTYIFEATIKSTKSNKILGSPIFKPRLHMGYICQKHQETKTSNSVTLVHSDIISANFSADNVVIWESPNIHILRYSAILEPVLLGIVENEPPFHVKVDADVTINPEMLDLASEGVFTALIKLPKGYDINDIDASTLSCKGASAVRGMISKDDKSIYMAEFNIQDLVGVLLGDAVTLTITGELADRTQFEGSCTVKIINSQPAEEKIEHLELLIRECKNFGIDLEYEQSCLSEAKDYFISREYEEAMEICNATVNSLEEKKKKFLETKELTEEKIENAGKEIENSKGFLINTSEAEAEIAKAKDELEKHNFDEAQNHVEKALEEILKQKKFRNYVCLFAGILIGMSIILAIIHRRKTKKRHMIENK